MNEEQAAARPEVLEKCTARAFPLSRRTFGAALLGAMVPPFLHPALADESPRRGGSLVYAVLGTPPTLDCHAANSFATMHFLAPHYSLLVKLEGEPMNVVGDLALDWTVSDDETIYTFRLHPEVYFHDGSHLTSADVKASLDRICNPPPGIVSLRKLRLAIITVIEAPDPTTVIIRLSRRSPAFLGTLAEPWNVIYSATKLIENPHYPEKTIMGSGPFVAKEYVPGSHAVGERFDKYFRSPLPYLDSFRAVTMTSASFMNALQGEQVMAEFRTLTPTQRDRLSRTVGDKMNIYEGSWGSGDAFLFNTRRKPFDDVRVRKALNIAVDRWGAAAALGPTIGLRYVGTVQRPVSPWAATEAEMVEMTGFGRNPAAAKEEARRLLAEAGQSNLKIRLINRNIANPYTSIGIYLVDQWKQIGVTTEHVQLNVAQLQTSLTAGDFDAAIDFITVLYDEPSLEFDRYLSSDRTTNNPAHYIDRHVDDLFDKQDREHDPQKRRQIVRELERYLLDQSYHVPFLWQARIVAIRNYIKGWKFTHQTYVGQDLATVWLDRPT